MAWLALLVAACGDNKIPATGDDTPIQCTAPETACGTACVNMTDDESNCGSCGNACDSGQVCIGGDCQAKVTCTAEQMDCNNVCKDTQTDEQNCGACDKKCDAGQVCIAGTCENTVTCTAPQVNCNNDCVDTTQDEANCGSCGNACSSTQTCVLGQCVATVSCTSPQIDCNNTCVDPRTDEANCGACGTVCTNTQTCTPNGNTGSCQTTTVCAAPTLNCDNTCVDPRTDEANCGACGTVCPIGQTCTPNGNTGSCQATVSCTTPEIDCGNQCVNPNTDNNNCGSCGNPCGGSTPDCCGGTCKNFDTDVQNCGSCGNACAADQTCNNGTCTDICATGLELCNGSCVDVNTDNTNCGACGIGCSPPSTTCQSGTCQSTCTGTVCNGTCTNTNTDNNNCGGCGITCTGGKTCNGGTCGCPAGTTDCNGTCKNLTNDDTACNSCNTPCAANQNCVNSQCVLDCPAGQIECNGSCVDPQTDDAHCGNCTTQCTGFFDCQAGGCVLNCQAPLSQCNGTCTNFQSDNNNCGSCNNPCPGGQFCSNGTCQLSCQAPTTLCNGACVNFDNDPLNCGMCGNECPANSTCSSGTCVCNAGTPDTCPGLCTNLGNDEGHCGNCNTSCSGTEQCDNGKCCTNGTVNCNNQCVTTNNNPLHCGGCGIACDPGEVCNNGTCQCPFGQTVCANDPTAGCQVVSNNPDACGPNCVVCSGATPFCVSNGCAASCPAPLEACGNDCVNKNDDNNNCGACGTVCPSGQGCSDGVCVPAIVVAPDLPKCVNGGPPITVPTEDGDICTGSLGAVTFRYGLCTCQNAGPLGHPLLVDAFDSRFGPYNPLDPNFAAKRMGGGIGINGTIQNTSSIEAFGDFWVFGAAQATKGPVKVHDRFLNKGTFDFTALVSVNEDVLGRCSVSGDPCLVIGSTCAGTGGTCTASGEDAFVGLAINKGGGGNFGMTVSGDLETGVTTCQQLVGEDVIPNALVRPGDCIEQAFDATIPPPCDCTSSPDPTVNQLIPVQSIVAHFADPQFNDNDEIGLSTQALNGASGAQRLDLPCGNYYLDQISISNATTIVVHGRTGLYIGGSVIVSQPIIFDLDPDATLDIFVAGVVKTSQDLTLGNPAFPRLSRMYVGSGSCSGSGSCTANAQCCSGVCGANGLCVNTGTGNVPEAFSMSGNSFLNGLMYTAYGMFRVTNPLIMNGAIFSKNYDSVEATIHFDKGAVTNGGECPPPDQCNGCQDCNNQACVNGQCGNCTDSSQCCSPLQCINGTCEFVQVQ